MNPLEQHLKEIAEKMEACWPGGESSHIDADLLLLETIEALTFESFQALVTRITDAYESIAKWYA